jgi:hypothetical protein
MYSQARQRDNGPFLDYVPITTGAQPSSAEELIMRQPPGLRGTGTVEKGRSDLI